VGDWAKYAVNWTYTSNLVGINDSLLMGIGNIEWLKGEVKAVSGDNVTIGLTTHFQNGTETVDSLDGDLETGDGNLSSLPVLVLMTPLVVKNGLNVGDSVPGFSENVSETASLTYSGYRRDINCFDFAVSTAGMSMGTYYYYDRPTGFLCEYETNFSMSLLTYSTSYSASMTLIETNMFASQSHVSALFLYAIIVAVAISIAIAILYFRKNRRKEATAEDQPVTQPILGHQPTTN
jgi:hypothetical protein